MKKINPFRLRSLLFVPAIKKEFIVKVLSLEGNDKPDGIIFDLEDSVHYDCKDEARKNLSQLFKDNDAIKALRDKYVLCVRVNKFGSKWFKNDLKFVNEARPDFLMLAKVDNPKEVKTIRNKSKTKQLIIAIETLEGLKNVSAITSEMNFYDLLVAGYEDPSSELLIERPANLNTANPLTYFFMKCLIEARSKDLIIIDAPSRKFADEKALKKFEGECSFNKDNGLNCKMAIHPNQVAIINKFFDKKLILSKAEKVLGQFKELKDGSFVVVNEQKEMMDTPSYKMYSKLLEYWNK